MKYNPVVAALIGGSAIGSTIVHDAHLVADLTQVFFDKPVMQAPAAARLPHGDEPEAPTWPLRMPMQEVAVTSSASVSFALNTYIFRP